MLCLLQSPWPLRPLNKLLIQHIPCCLQGLLRQAWVLSSCMHRQGGWIHFCWPLWQFIHLWLVNTAPTLMELKLHLFLGGGLTLVVHINMGGVIRPSSLLVGMPLMLPQDFLVRGLLPHGTSHPFPFSGSGGVLFLGFHCGGRASSQFPWWHSAHSPALCLWLRPSDGLLSSWMVSTCTYIGGIIQHFCCSSAAFFDTWGSSFLFGFGCNDVLLVSRMASCSSGRLLSCGCYSFTGPSIINPNMEILKQYCCCVVFMFTILSLSLHGKHV